jgi:hypothetical protein
MVKVLPNGLQPCPDAGQVLAFQMEATGVWSVLEYLFPVLQCDRKSVAPFLVWLPHKQQAQTFPLCEYDCPNEAFSAGEPVHDPSQNAGVHAFTFRE